MRWSSFVDSLETSSTHEPHRGISSISLPLFLPNSVDRPGCRDSSSSNKVSTLTPSTTLLSPQSRQP